MPPEQAKGRPADKRSDGWSFGVIVCIALSPDGRTLMMAASVSGKRQLYPFWSPDSSFIGSFA